MKTATLFYAQKNSQWPKAFNLGAMNKMSKKKWVHFEKLDEEYGHTEALIMALEKDWPVEIQFC